MGREISELTGQVATVQIKEEQILPSGGLAIAQDGVLLQNPSSETTSPGRRSE